MNFLISFKYATPYRYSRYFGIGQNLVERGHNVRLYASVSNSVVPYEVPRFKGFYKTEQINGLEVIWCNGPLITSNSYKRALTWFLFELQVIIHNFLVGPMKVDVVVSSSPSIFCVISGWIISKVRRSKWFFEVRDVWPITLTQPGGYSNSHPVIKLMKRFEEFAYRNADLIIGTVPNLVARVEEVLGLNHPKVVHLGQGVDEYLFGEGKEILPKTFFDTFIPSGKIIISYAGTMNLNNPIGILFEVARECEKPYPDLHFVILGDGSRKKDYEKEYADLKNISFPPRLTKSQMASFLEKVDIGYDAVSSDVSKYGLSRNKWIDYMYNKCIVVCSYDGHRSMIDEAESGYFLPFGDKDALKRCLIDLSVLPKLEMNQMKERAKKYILEYHSYENLTSRFLYFVDELNNGYE